jgi:hypothetical protein
LREGSGSRADERRAENESASERTNIHGGTNTRMEEAC